MSNFLCDVAKIDGEEAAPETNQHFETPLHLQLSYWSNKYNSIIGGLMDTPLPASDNVC